MASSSSTTETTTYMLEKYSRAYTAKKASGTSEWQHFTNPVLRLILDSKLSPHLSDSSLRMRIVWTMDDDKDIVLEDLDLFAFSLIKTNNSGRDKADSSPLKAVYRDTTFGLRYLYVPESTESHKVYRRFQVSFATSSLALQLVNAIQDVCPCKPNDPPNPKERKAVAARPSFAPQRQDTIIASNPTPEFSVSMIPQTSSLFHATTTQTPLRSEATFRIPDPPAASQPVLLPFSVHRPPSRIDRPSASPAVPEPRPSSSHSVYDHPMPDALQTALTLTNAAQPLQKPSSLSSLPDSSPPTSTADSAMMPPPPPAQVSTYDTHADTIALTAALREATGLYDLSHVALERLVGDVVREDGFVGLLEKMSSMWAMKALV
ncbi:hypothetical protein R3P38DRAFT_2904523 [Favolaschia claudopus]|uniref:Uncharacterized protein n=1 Tax=Favolaschia claudopus TaxID=2862362 RepID=A0AAW0CEJ9_9AGAR